MQLPLRIHCGCITVWFLQTTPGLHYIPGLPVIQIGPFTMIHYTSPTHWSSKLARLVVLNPTEIAPTKPSTVPSQFRPHWSELPQSSVDTTIALQDVAKSLPNSRLDGLPSYRCTANPQFVCDALANWSSPPQHLDNHAIYGDQVSPQYGTPMADLPAQPDVCDKTNVRLAESRPSPSLSQSSTEFTRICNEWLEKQSKRKNYRH